MLKFYFNPSPNPAKVALFLEESRLPYEIVPIDVRKGEQFEQEFAALNPNGKIPVIVDGSATVFDSTAILLYLAEKTSQFLPGENAQARGELYSWLMFVASGVGPYSGQSVHFTHYAPSGQEYATRRYQFEVRRHYSILETRLASRSYLLGEKYTIVDMSAWGWARALPFVLKDDAVWGSLPNLKRWFDAINARPAAIRAEALKDRFTFKGEMDDEARRIMFPHLAL